VGVMADEASRVDRLSTEGAEAPAEKSGPARLRRANRLMAKEGSRPQNVAALRAVKRNALGPAPVAPDIDEPAPAEHSEDQRKVLSLVERLQHDVQCATRRKLSWPLISAAVCILTPTLLAAIFYAFIAADRYVSEARFAVRTSEGQAADVLGVMTGMPSSTVVSDSYIVTDYILSREMVNHLERRIPLRQIFSHPSADFMTGLDPTLTLEEFVDYWNDRVSVYYDSTKNTIAVQAEAFVSEDAERIVREIVDVVRLLVNDLSAQARRDAVQFASSEVARAELRVRGARDDLIQFRGKNKDFDPAQTASASLQIVSQLEGERSQLNSQLAAVSGYLGANAPSVQMLKSRIGALQTEIDRIQGEMSTSGNDADTNSTARVGDDSGALVNVVAAYQELLLNQQFAEQAYTAALGSLERARAEADRTQSYLAIYLNPNIPEAAAYPRRLRNVLIVLILAAVAWAIGALAFLTARDHLV